MIAQRPRPRIHVLGPVLLIGFGAIALLATSGLLTQSGMDRLLQLWPLVLVLLGVEVVVVHLLPGRAGALVALVAMLAVIALGVGFTLSVPAAPTTMYRAGAPVAGAAAGTLRLDAGRGTVHLSGQDLGGDLYQARVRYAANAQPTVDVAGGTVHLATPHSPAGVLWFNPATSDDVTLALSSRVPWAVTVNGAGLRGQADLTGLDVSSFTLNGAGSTLDLRLPARARGAVTVTVNGVGVDLTVRVPQQTGAHAVVEGLATRLDVDGTSVNGTAWTSPGFDPAAGHYEIRATGVGSHVRLEVAP